MPLIHAPFCTVCEQHRTTHPSGICSHCRRLKGSKPCRSCGDRTTSHESGLCYRCRSRASDSNNIDNAIIHYEDVLLALKMLKRNCSFNEIGKVLGKSRSGAFTFCQNAIRYPLICEE